MRKTWLLLLGIFFCCLLGRATAQETPKNVVLTPKDSLFLTVEDGKKMIFHTVKAKQTLYSISRFYGLGMEELLDNNPTLRTAPTLVIGQKLKIPIPNRAIKRYKNKGFVAAKNTPIYYVVQPGDNLYQICKRYFNMPVDSITRRNKIKDNTIKAGQLLLMGWMGTEGIPEDWRPAPMQTQPNAYKLKYDEEKEKHKELESQGVCYWHKDSQERGRLYALHRDAAIGTIIAVTNPMYKTTVYAKVIGRIPEGYERNVEVVLSPEAALRIGARDPRFFVKVKYLK